MAYCAVCGKWFKNVRAAYMHFLRKHPNLYVKGTGIIYLILRGYIVTADTVKEFFDGVRNGLRIVDYEVKGRCADNPKHLLVELTREDGAKLTVVMSENGLDYLRTQIKKPVGRHVW